MDITQTIKQRKRNDGLIIGTKETLKNKDDLDHVVIAANIPVELREELENRLDVEIKEFNGSNHKLGSLCGKPFSVATVGLKEATETVR